MTAKEIINKLFLRNGKFSDSMLIDLVAINLYQCNYCGSTMEFGNVKGHKDNCIIYDLEKYFQNGEQNG